MSIFFELSEIKVILSVSFSGVSSLSYTLISLWLTIGQINQSVENPKGSTDDY